LDAEEAGLMAFLILKTFQAVLAACPAVANTCSVASPALFPNLHEFKRQELQFSGVQTYLYVVGIGVPE